MKMTKQDLEDLARARQLLENPSLAARLTNALGVPVEKGLQLLPARVNETIQSAVEASLEKAVKIAVMSLSRKRSVRRSYERIHTAAVVGTGGIGGAFGLAGLPMELPVSTGIMLRSIADIARSEGEDLSATGTQLACLEVFALGGRSPQDDAVETGYYAVRAALAGTVAEAARHLAQRGLTREGAPALVRLISAISARFGIVVSEKVAAMAVPAIGAVGGGLVNGLFMDHFQSMARGHFIVRRLERKYGGEAVRLQYTSLATHEPAPRPAREEKGPDDHPVKIN